MKLSDKLKRKNSLLHFGYGADVMKSTTVCINCNSLEESSRIFCSRCQTRLPLYNLYDFYRSQHKTCQKCGCVLSSSMTYCPKCGDKVKSNTLRAEYVPGRRNVK